MADVTAGPDRPATALTANDLARSPSPAGGGAGLRHAGAGQGGRRLRPFPNRPFGTHGAIILFAGRDRLPGAALLAFIVVVEHRALGAGDPCTAVAIGPEAAFADQRTDPRRFRLDRIARVDAGHLGIEPGAGIAVEQRQ